MKNFVWGFAAVCVLASSAVAQNTPIVVAAPKSANKTSNNEFKIDSSYYRYSSQRQMQLATARKKTAKPVTASLTTSEGGSQTDACGCNSGCETGCDTGCGTRRRILPRLGQSFFGGGNCQDDCCGCSCCCRPCKYVSFFGGVTTLHDTVSLVTTAPQPIELNKGFVFGMASGCYLNANTRVEMEGSWRNNTFTVDPFTYGRLNNYSTMFNMLRDFGNGRLKPYVGGGIGFSLVKGEFFVVGTPYEIDDYAFSYQGIAGFSYQVASNRDVFVDYRFLGNTTVDIINMGMDAGDFTFLSHNLVFGIRFNR